MRIFFFKKKFPSKLESEDRLSGKKFFFEIFKKAFFIKFIFHQNSNLRSGIWLCLSKGLVSPNLTSLNLNFDSLLDFSRYFCHKIQARLFTVSLNVMSKPKDFMLKNFIDLND